jgi:hypothetical protein
MFDFLALPEASSSVYGSMLAYSVEESFFGEISRLESVNMCVEISVRFLQKLYALHSFA